MFFGRWDAVIDEGWRLAIRAPLASHFDNFILLQEGGKDGCIRISTPPNNIREVRDPTSAFLVELRENSKGCKRFLVPGRLRRSTSFYFGKNVTLAGKGQYLEIWPWPQWPHRKKRKKKEKKENKKEGKGGEKMGVIRVSEE